MKHLSPAEAGAELVRRNGCLACHTTDGTPKTGPTFKGLYGQTATFTDGTSAVVDDNLIRETILEPMARIRQGYQPVMPTFKGRLKDDDITKIIAYLKTLK
jgi:cytochrome c oxidase subunit 2